MLVRVCIVCFIILARIVCALAVRGGSPVSWMYVVMCRLGPTGCNYCSMS